MAEDKGRENRRWPRPAAKWWRGWGAFLRVFRAFPLAALSLVFLAGIIFWSGFNWSLEMTNTEKFCISCHEMKEYVFKEYKHSIHYTNRVGVRATCPDCHVPREWIHKVVRKVGATNEFFHWLAGSINTPQKYEAKRGKLARQVWASMKATNSRECRNCHEMASMSVGHQTSKANIMHVLAESWEATCIECHQGIAHSLPKGFDKEVVMDKLHERMKKEKVNCRPCHMDMAKPPPGQGW